MVGIAFFRDFGWIFCNIRLSCATVILVMVGVMTKPIDFGEPCLPAGKVSGAGHKPNDDLVVKARTDADSLGRLYELYYEQVFRFCVHRLFSKEAAEDVTSSVFLSVAGGIKDFKGRTEQEFRGWLYAIAANQTNAYIRQTRRRKRLLDRWLNARSSMLNAQSSISLDWPAVYAAILRLNPKYQTIVTLRFFEGMDCEEIGRIINARAATVRVMLHRSLERLKSECSRQTK